MPSQEVGKFLFHHLLSIVDIFAMQQLCSACACALQEKANNFPQEKVKDFSESQKLFVPLQPQNESQGKKTII